MPDLPNCACGCGKPVTKPGNMYLCGHGRSGDRVTAQRLRREREVRQKYLESLPQGTIPENARELIAQAEIEKLPTSVNSSDGRGWDMWRPTPPLGRRLHTPKEEY